MTAVTQAGVNQGVPSAQYIERLLSLIGIADVLAPVKVKSQLLSLTFTMFLILESLTAVSTPILTLVLPTLLYSSMGSLVDEAISA